MLQLSRLLQRLSGHPWLAMTTMAMALVACAPPPQLLHLEGRAMGTTWHVTAIANPQNGPMLEAALGGRLQSLVHEMSAWEPESDLSRFNRADAGTSLHFPPDLCQVVAHAVALARDTEGAYDPSIGPLVRLWGFGPDGLRRSVPPSAEAITAAQATVGWKRLPFDPATCQARQPGALELDVNSLAPGHGVDAMAKVLDTAGIASYLVELGGEMRARGHNPDGHPWRIAVEWPDGSSGQDLVLSLTDAGLGTSGDYRSGFDHNGRHYSHTLDPRTGEPVRHDGAAVTVISRTAMQADAMAAALMVLGPNEGMAYARAHGVAAVFTRRTPHGPERLFTPAMERHLSP